MSLRTLEEVNAYDFLITGNAQDFKLLPGVNRLVWNANSTDFELDLEITEYLRNL